MQREETIILSSIGEHLDLTDVYATINFND